ncbi:winged helix-turn-helix transcriptional regulator [Flindersiella endophytica]
MHRKSRREDAPLFELFEVLGQRWALRILWELRSDEALTYRELAERIAGLSTSVLTHRLRDLRAARLVEHSGGYRLSDQGRKLLPHLENLRAWAEREDFRSGT